MLSVIIPLRDEEENVEPMYGRLSAVLDAIDEDWEIIFSVDPSTDRTEDLVGALEESHGSPRGLVALVGFRQTGVPYDREARKAGTSKYNRFLGSVVIGVNGIVGFSRYPLQVISLLGVGISMVAFLLALTYFILKVSGYG